MCIGNQYKQALEFGRGGPGVMHALLYSASALALLSATPAAAQPSAETQTDKSDQSEDETIIEEITVEGRRISRYRIDTSASATRVPIDIKTLPFSVQVVPAEILSDQAAVQLADAYRNVSGVRQQANGNNTTSREGAYIRGYPNFDVNRNAFPIRGIGALDLAAVETVDVLKGPASMTYGQVEPGGLINYTTKRPLERFFAGVQAFVGSFDYLRGTIDVTGPLNSSRTILARGVAAYTNADSYRDFVESELFMVAPSVTFRPADGINVTAEMSRSEANRTFDAGVPFSDTGKPVARIRNYYGDPILDGSKLGDTFATIDMDARVTDQLTLRTAYVFHKFSHDFEALRPLDVRRVGGELRLRRRYELRTIRSNEHQGIGILTWKGDTGPVGHTLSAIVDYRHLEFEMQRSRDNRSVDLSISVLNPTYGVNVGALTINRDFNNRQVNKEFGVSLSDQISLFNDRLYLLAGLRYDNVKIKGGPNIPVDYQVDDVSMSAGILFEALENVSVYASYSESFNARDSSTYTGSDGEALPPIRGTQIEAGIKADLLNESLLITAAAFEIKRVDDPIYFFDPITDSSYYVSEGRTRSRGFEIDVIGDVTPQFKVIGSYAYTDAEVTAGESSVPTGSRLRNVPRHAASLWGSYELSLGSNGNKLTLGAGAFVTGKRPVDSQNSFDLPGYTQVDASVTYEHKLRSSRVLTFRINARNLFNKTIYEASSTRVDIQTGAPRSLIASLGVKF